MTPEEKAIIDAAIYLKYCIDAGTAGDPPSIDRLLDTVDALIFAYCGQHEPTYREWVGQHADASTYPCWECLVDPIEDPLPWCDCRPEDSAEPAHPYPCRLRAHTPENCLNRPESAGPPDKTWEPATLLYCLAGDRIRIGQDETDVLRSSSGAWHAQVVSSVLPSGKTWDKVTPWEHTELRLDLSANPGFQEYPPNLPCEILCTPERLAILHLMQGIPGTTVIKR